MTLDTAICGVTLVLQTSESVAPIPSLARSSLVRAGGGFLQEQNVNINVPPLARDHFWEEPPPGSMEFWSFRFPPPCKVGDPLIFRFDGKIVARAVVHRIEKPGESKCDATGRFERGFKVFWTQGSFVDMRGMDQPGEGEQHD